MGYHLCDSIVWFLEGVHCKYSLASFSPQLRGAARALLQSTIRVVRLLTQEFRFPTQVAVIDVGYHLCDSIVWFLEGVHCEYSLASLLPRLCGAIRECALPFESDLLSSFPRSVNRVVRRTVVPVAHIQSRWRHVFLKASPDFHSRSQADRSHYQNGYNTCRMATDLLPPSLDPHCCWIVGLLHVIVLDLHVSYHIPPVLCPGLTLLRIAVAFGRFELHMLRSLCFRIEQVLPQHASPLVRSQVRIKH